MAKELTTEERQEAERLLESLQAKQDAYWGALGELEAELGLDLDGTRDYSGLTVADLDEDEENDNEESA